MVEIGYSIGPEFQPSGLWPLLCGRIDRLRLAAAGGDTSCRASISPENVGSLRIVKSLRFQHVGEQWDEEDGLEHIYELPRENWAAVLV